MANRSAARSISEYIAEFPPQIQGVLQEMRAVIAEAAPGASERISYSMPTFDLNGKHLVHFAGHKNHVGLYPMPRAIEAFREELARYKSSKGSVQLPLDEPLPTDLIRRIVQFRISEVTGGAAE